VRVGFACVAPPVESELGPARQDVDDLVAGRWSIAGESQIPRTLRSLQILAWTAQTPSTIGGLVI